MCRNLLFPFHSSGSVSIPLNRPIAGVCRPNSKSGKVLAIGSAHMFADAYLDREENGKLFDVFLDFLTSEKIVLNSIDANEPDVFKRS